MCLLEGVVGLYVLFAMIQTPFELHKTVEERDGLGIGGKLYDGFFPFAGLARDVSHSSGFGFHGDGGDFFDLDLEDLFHGFGDLYLVGVICHAERVLFIVHVGYGGFGDDGRYYDVVCSFHCA